MKSLDDVLADARERYRLSHPSCERLDAEASVHLPGGNTRSVLDFEPFPFRVVENDGAYLVDVEGHRFMDLLGNYSAGLLGHRPEPILRAVTDVMRSGWTAGAIRSIEADFAGLICERFASIDLVRFTNSGTEANLMAIASAQHFTGRSAVMVFDHAYHGGLLYFGDGGRDLLVPHDWVIAGYNDLGSVDAALTQRRNDIACVLVEPMMAASGCIPGSQEFLTGLKQRAEEIGALLVFDEVMTSRLSPSGFQGLSGITPDMTTLGKYLAGGMNFGAFGGRSDVMSAFDPATGGRLSHGGTYNNSEVTMAAGVAALEELLTAEALKATNVRGDQLRDSLNSVFVHSGLPMTVTGLGSLMTIHATSGPVDSPRDLTTADDRLKESLFFQLLEDGFYIARRGFIALSFDITDDHVDQFVASVARWAGNAVGFTR